MARPRKTNVTRDGSGISREYRIRQKTDYQQSVARRAIDLIKCNVEPFHAENSLAGYTLGRLCLRRDITRNQHDAGDEWAKLVHRHAAIMGYKLHIPTPSFQMVGSGISTRREPDDDEILAVRRKWSDCYGELMRACRDFGLAVRNVTYGVCVENWQLGDTRINVWALKIGLNSLSTALK